jgi:hypothetical protein
MFFTEEWVVHEIYVTQVQFQLERFVRTSLVILQMIQFRLNYISHV